MKTAVLFAGLCVAQVNTFADDLKKELQEQKINKQNEKKIIESFVKNNENIICYHLSSTWQYVRKDDQLYYLIRRSPYIIPISKKTKEGFLFYLKEDFLSNPTSTKKKDSNLALQLDEDTDQGIYTLYVKALSTTLRPTIESHKCEVCEMYDYDADRGGKGYCTSSKIVLKKFLNEKKEP